MKLLINNGLIVDPGENLEAAGDLIIEDGIISEIILTDGKKPLYDRKLQNDEDIVYLDAKGKWVVPGLIDLHVHLREPGFEYKEDIESGCKAAAKGGITTLCCMPNTNPAIDNAATVSYIDQKSKKVADVNVLALGAVTKGQQGAEPADLMEMADVRTRCRELTGKGICGISEDGKTVENEEVMLRTMKKAKELGITVFSHAEPEVQIVERDLKLAELSGCSLHFCHISKKESLELIRKAKKRGIPVTAETAPHYFTLDSSQVNADVNKKMNPPLRTKEDVEAIIEALKDGTLDAIATDHAPHHVKDKELSFEKAANGVVGLETSFPISYTMLVKTGKLTPLELILKMSTAPADILGVDRGSLKIGKAADLAIIDVDQEYEVRPEDFASKAKNSPFLGMKVFGKVKDTIVDGKVIWED